MNLNMSDKKILKTMCELLEKGYSLNEIKNILTGQDMLEVLICKVNRQFKKLPNNIKENYTITKNENFVRNLAEEEKENVANILVFKLKSIVYYYKRKKDISSDDSHNIKKLEEDILEVQEMVKNKEFKITITQRDKDNSILYKAIENN